MDSETETIPMAVNSGFGIKESKLGVFICHCCGGCGDTLETVRHDDTCSYNNTHEAVSEFVPATFLLGGENYERTAPEAYCVDGIGLVTCKNIRDTVDRLAAATMEERADAFIDLALLFPMAQKLLYYFIDNPIKSDTLSKAVGNYLCYELASRRELISAADELNRALARHDTVGELFKDTLRKAYSVPDSVLK